MKLIILSTFLLTILLSSCVTLKPYERQYVADPEMQMSDDAGQSFSGYVHSIREGASPSNSVKGSGGCGCN